MNASDIKAKVASDSRWAARAMVAIDRRNLWSAKDHDLMSDLADWWYQYDHFTVAQWETVFGVMPRYSRKLAEIAAETKKRRADARKKGKL